MVQVSASILSADFTKLGQQVEMLERAGCDMVHMDIMDGNYVPNITYGPFVVAQLRPLTKMIFDVHLMIANADFFIPEFVKAGADMITVHAEACTHLHRSVQQIKNYGIKAGVALNPATPPDTVQYILSEIDTVLLMSVNPGFGGQRFIPQMLHKVKACREMLCGYPVSIEIDGGVNEKTAPELVAAGADILVSGSYLFQGDTAKKISGLQAL